MVYECLGTGPSRLVPLLPAAPAQLSGRPNVDIIETLLYTATEQGDVYLGPFFYKAGSHDRSHHARWLVEGPKLFQDRRVKPLQPTLMGDMNKIQEGFMAMAQGQTHGQRLVWV